MQTMPPKQDLTQTLVDRARAMLPALRERAQAAKDNLQGPDDTIADFQEAGFFKILQPKRWGGYELDPQSFYAVQMTLAEACMSSAWVLGVVAVHNWQLALFDAQAQADVWNDDPDHADLILLHAARRGNPGRGRLPDQRALGLLLGRRSLPMGIPGRAGA
jgi:alkylation response protein AidB-like acyl-CoA dehydrogenase